MIVLSLYLLGIIVAVVMAKIFRKTLFPGENTPFVLELPPYRIPTFRGVMIHMWDRGSEFLQKAGTLIFAVIILIWVLSNLPYGVAYAAQESYIGQIGSFLAVIFKPLGFGTWEAATALIFGVVAKEVVVATLGTVYASYGSLGTAIQQLWTPLAGYSFMIMTLLYTPCIATLSAIRRETRSTRWMLFSVGYSFAVAWVASFLFYQLGGLILSLVGKL
jgi:ferrous iron transport protein B